MLFRSLRGHDRQCVQNAAGRIHPLFPLWGEGMESHEKQSCQGSLISSLCSDIFIHKRRPSSSSSTVALNKDLRKCRILRLVHSPWLPRPCCLVLMALGWEFPRCWLWILGTRHVDRKQTLWQKKLEGNTALWTLLQFHSIQAHGKGSEKPLDKDTCFPVPLPWWN